MNIKNIVYKTYNAAYAASARVNTNPSIETIYDDRGVHLGYMGWAETLLTSNGDQITPLIGRREEYYIRRPLYQAPNKQAYYRDASDKYYQLSKY